MNTIRTLIWQCGYSRDRERPPEEFFPAAVPGAVQLDYAAAHGWPDPFHGLNFEAYEWMEDVWWTYRSTLCFSLVESETACLRFGGLDYRYTIRLDGETVREGEGMFTPVLLDVNRFSGRECSIEVLLHPVPKATETPDRSQARACCKPAVSYGWDWHPRLIPTGMWEDVTLEIRRRSCIEELEVTYALEADGTAQVRAEIRTGEETTVSGKLTDPDGNVVACAECRTERRRGVLSIRVSDVRLWWPHGQGEQPLYTLSIHTAGDEREKVLGFRRVRLVMNEGEWEKPRVLPKSQSSAPITIEINGRRIFAKGANWLNPDIFPGRIGTADYERLLTLAKEAHMNLLRVWGGGIVNKEAFYTLCDQMGILVWQEFPLACNEYPDSPAYLNVLRQEAVSILRRLREHPCVVLWCGGNELFNSWSGMTEQSRALRMLGALCLEYAPGTPFLMTSPVGGMGHGHYLNMENGVETLTQLMQSGHTAYTEFGRPGPASIDYLRGFLSEEELASFPEGSVWKAHHAFGMWAYPDTWLRLSEAEFFCGGYDGLEDLTEKLGAVQATSYRAAYEEMRRQWPRCSMALCWCLNEPWPAIANNSLLSWPDVPKPAYEAVKAALRPQLVSVQTERLRYRPGESVTARLWLLNDADAPMESGCVRVWLYEPDNGDRRRELLCWHHGGTEKGKNLPGPWFTFSVPGQKTARFELLLEAEKRPDLTSRYGFFACREEGSRKTGGLNM